ncbi:MAG: FlgD immunoglobulin-like domain containing protein [Candidatus Krumholzibacteria bacterium]|nr:FlgD immunoglobulin-like domain containing protein [Candidatus Krumholzibacteria bacterium]
MLNFLDSTDYIQRNSFVVVELLSLIQEMIPPSRDIALLGASMGGLCCRYALAYMEHGGLAHRVRTFVSYDSPHRGADIPLGVQYWVLFFAGQSAAAEEMLAGLESPAARQMLEYHFTDPPGTTGASDPLYGVLQAELAALGGYPSGLRMVAFANGSGHAAGQGFGAGAQLILYEYSSLLVDIVGNVWAVPDQANQMIFDGLIDMIWPLPDEAMTVWVQGTRPLDNAPGGSRPSMAQMDSTEAPYGDIIALHERHCFIPTVSALDLATDDLFHDVAADPAVMALTPFDTIYWAPVNEAHVFISPEYADLLLAEVGIGVTGDEPGLPGAGRAVLRQNRPNPFNPATTIEYSLHSTGHVSLRVYDVAGRLLRTLVDGERSAGRHQIVWNGTGDSGAPVASGVYFCRLKAGPYERTRKMILLR